MYVVQTWKSVLQSHVSYKTMGTFSSSFTVAHTGYLVQFIPIYYSLSLLLVPKECI